jgi:hypothetical protein
MGLCSGIKGAVFYQKDHCGGHTVCSKLRRFGSERGTNNNYAKIPGRNTDYSGESGCRVSLLLKPSRKCGKKRKISSVRLRYVNKHGCGAWEIKKEV